MQVEDIKCKTFVQTTFIYVAMNETNLFVTFSFIFMAGKYKYGKFGKKKTNLGKKDKFSVPPGMSVLHFQTAFNWSDIKFS